MKDLKNTFLAKFQGLKKIKFSFGSDADKDWVILCYVTFLIFVFIISWSAYVFYKVNSTNSGEELNAKTTSLIDKESLTSVIEKYDKKAIELNILKDGFPDVSNPAL